MKNGNGQGSVYKLSGKRRKPWVVCVTIGFDETGKQKREIIGYYETRKEAQFELINYLNNPLLYSGKTFKDVKDLWYNAYVKNITDSTLNNNNSQLKKLDIFNDIKIKDLKLHVLQNFFDELDCAYGTKNVIKSLLNLIFEYALKNDFIEVNKVKFIELGKSEKVLERKIFTSEEINILFDNVNSKKKYINLSFVVLILIYTGLRISEFLNLKVSDIDLKNRTINVLKSKTKNGIRSIPISNKVIKLFNDNINYNQEYFYYSNKNTKIHYATFEKQFGKMLKLLELQEHTIHDTRHTFATLLNNANANSTSITKLIGHSDFSITENIYTHKDMEELRKAVDLLN